MLNASLKVQLARHLKCTYLFKFLLLCKDFVGSPLVYCPSEMLEEENTQILNFFFHSPDFIPYVIPLELYLSPRIF